MDVYLFSSQKTAQDACNAVWSTMSGDNSIKDARVSTKQILQKAVTTCWDYPKQDISGNWTIFIPDTKFVLTKQAIASWNPPPNPADQEYINSVTLSGAPKDEKSIPDIGISL